MKWRDGSRLHTLRRARVAAALLLAATLSNVHSVHAQSISTPTRYVEQPFDVLRYEAFLALDSLPQPLLGTSTCTWHVRWKGAPDTLRFHLRSLDVLSVAYWEAGQWREVPFFVRGEPSDATFHYAVAALPTHRRGDTVVLRITYRGTMTGEPAVGGMSWGGVQREGEVVYTLGVGFYNNYVSATQHWLPCYDHPSDKALTEFWFRVPARYVVASGGELVDVIDSANVRIYHYRMHYPAATYLLTFAALPESIVSRTVDTTSLPVPIVLYARRSDSAATARSFRLLPQMVRTFERYFGRYPFEKVGYVMTQKGAMEHQTMISYPTSIARSGDTLNLVAAHELAHQWFGDCVTPYDFRDAWFNESFATFCESLWRAEIGGWSAYLDEQQRKINAYLNQYAKPGSPLFEGILPMYDFDRRPPSSNYPHVIYEKGAAVLGMLRYVVGDSAFFRWCRHLLERYRYGNVNIDTLQSALVRQGVDSSLVARFFSEWIYGKGWAVLSIEAAKRPSAAGWKASVHIRQVQPDSLGVYTTLPLELSFIGRDTVHRTVVVTAREVTVELDSLPDFTSIVHNRGVHVRSLVLLSSVPTVTHVADEASDEELRVMPNPAGDCVWIAVGRYVEGVLEIVNVRGEVVRRVPRAELVAVPTVDLAAGVYYVRAQSRGRKVVMPFLVVR